MVLSHAVCASGGSGVHDECGGRNNDLGSGKLSLDPTISTFDFMPITELYFNLLSNVLSSVGPLVRLYLQGSKLRKKISCICRMEMVLDHLKVWSQFCDCHGSFSQKGYHVGRVCDRIGHSVEPCLEDIASAQIPMIQHFFLFSVSNYFVNRNVGVIRKISHDGSRRALWKVFGGRLCLLPLLGKL